ncbi:MAG: 30S ribosomal protein S20 [Thermodesulfobacteriota bacterium]|nr:30S ribosomal protein S20 [Thermodesulfobacteriota bacterium]
MANKSKSARKRIRQDVKKRIRNKSVMSFLKTHIKQYKESIKADGPNKEDLLKRAISLFDKAAAKGVIHKRNASRNISRISKLS